MVGMAGNKKKVSLMQYLGGKSRTWKIISKYLESIRTQNQPYLEPFVGGAWILQGISGRRYASDANKALITMYQHLQNGWIPPDSISEDTYKEYKSKQDNNDPLTAFIGFGCSFGGKWFGGYARGSESRNYATNAKNSLLRQLPKIKNVRFSSKDYFEISPTEMLIYCDPPYANTTGYGAIGKFDNELFWNVMRDWSLTNTVVISEYDAPQDFKCVLEIQTKTDLHTKIGKSQLVEKLFMLEQ